MSPAALTNNQPLLAVTVILYVVLMYALAIWAKRRVHSAEDFIVAGRRLPLSLAWMTLLATWFGAGTMLAVTDEVRQHGLQRAALDPFGAGTCLLLAGWFIARPLWKMKLLTVCDFFARRFGATAEMVSALILVPSYFGWIAAQFVALAGLLELVFGLDPGVGILIVAVVGVGYTMLGGMWSVTLTDAAQVSLVLGGLVILAWKALSALGQGDAAAGLARFFSETPPEMLHPLPAGGSAALLGWFSAFVVGALGNLPGQDLLQRVFAARSAPVARQACLVAGVVYLIFGLIPVGLGLAANLLVPDANHVAILPALALTFLGPVTSVVFTLALLSAVLSTIDSAILSPASILAQNVFPRLTRRRLPPLALNRVAILLVALASLYFAYQGQSAFSLLESAYELVFVGLFVPLVLGIYTRPRNGAPAITCMLVGTGSWLLHSLLHWETWLAPWLAPLGWHLPQSLAATGLGLLTYLVLHRWLKRWAASPGGGFP